MIYLKPFVVQSWPTIWLPWRIESHNKLQGTANTVLQSVGYSTNLLNNIKSAADINCILSKNELPREQKLFDYAVSQLHIDLDRQLLVLSIAFTQLSWKFPINQMFIFLRVDWATLLLLKKQPRVLTVSAKMKISPWSMYYNMSVLQLLNLSFRVV